MQRNLANNEPSKEALDAFKKRVTLKSFKHLASASEETLCFTAKVLLDGKSIGSAKNAGHGGETSVYLDKQKFDWHGYGLWVDWDKLVDALSFEELRKVEEKKAKARIAHALKKHIVFTQKGEEFKGRHFIFTNGNSSPEMAQRIRNRLAEMPNVDLILNDHPVEVALPFFLKDA
jgi:hypothetical protein